MEVARHVKEELPKARTERLIVQDLPDETLVYDNDNHEAHCLNASAAAVWKSCDGSRTVGEIATRVAPAAPREVAEQVVEATLDQLAERRLLVRGGRRERGVSRREVLQRLVAVGIAAPIIESIVSPAAADSLSGATGPTGPTGQ